MKEIIAVFAICLLTTQCVSASLSESNDIHELVKTCASGIKTESRVAVGIVKTESAGNPFSIGVNSKNIKLKRQPKNLIEAMEVAIWLAKNRYNFDAGIAQINSVNIEKLIQGDINFRMRKVFDPCENLQLAETIFNSCYEMTGSTIGALSCYNTGDARKGVKNGYVAKVLANIPDLLDVRGPDAAVSKVPQVRKQKRTVSDEVDASSKDEIQLKKKSDSESGDIFATDGKNDIFENECVEQNNQKCNND